MEAAAPRLVVFDCDGTLVDGQHAIIAAMDAGCGAVGLPPPPSAVVRRIVGLPLVEGVARLASGADPQTVMRIAEAYKAAFQANRQSGSQPEPLYPGLREALDALESAGCLLGIATGKSRRGLLATLHHHGLTDRFVTLQTSDLLPGKPNPDMVHQAMAEAAADPAGTVVVGDTTYDVHMARNAGVRCVGVSWGYHAPEELYAAGAALVVDAFQDVPAAVLDLMHPTG